MRYGELYWVTLPDRGGRARRGRRPALIWQDTDALPPVATVLIIPLTAQLDRLRFGGTTLIQPSDANGLVSRSVALAFSLVLVMFVGSAHASACWLMPTSLAFVRLA